MNRLISRDLQNTNLKTNITIMINIILREQYDMISLTDFKKKEPVLLRLKRFTEPNGH